MKYRVRRTMKWDMRKMRAFEEKHRRLNKGECIVAFNNSGSMFRAVDWTGGIHQWYRKADEDPWDFERAKAIFHEACGVELLPKQEPRVVKMPRRKVRKAA